MAQQTLPPELGAVDVVLQDDARSAPRVGHKKSRNGCAQCKRRHVKCNEEQPCSNCVRHGVACSLAGGPNVPREDAKPRISPTVRSIDTPQDSVLDGENSEISRRGSSPLRSLTRFLDRKDSSMPDEEWMTDLQLMHHFDNHTQDILTQMGEDCVDVWQKELPRLTFSFTYAMHIVLGISALHKASTQPHQARMLRMSAVSHLDRALALYGQDSAPPSIESASARMCFSWFLTYFAYAVPSSIPPIDAACEHLRLIQGVSTAIEENFALVVQSPWAPLLNRSLHECMGMVPENGAVVPEGMNFGLSHLDYMLGMHPMLPEERQACAQALTELKQLYDNVLQAQTSTGIGLVLCWPKQDPTVYRELLIRRVPQALVILAHYSVVLNILDERWWMHGWPSRLLQHIVDNLDERWKNWVEWPVQTVLMQDQPSPAVNISLSPDGTAIIL